MAINNGAFKGIIDGKSAKDYPNPDNSILKLGDRIKYIEKVFNLDELGISRDEYILNIWDSGCNTVHLNKDDMLWTDTKTAKKFERYGTYLINCENKNEYRASEPKTISLSCISEDVTGTNDKNYRLAPPENIYRSDYYLPKQFKGAYRDYLKIHEQNMKKLEEKFGKYNEERYGYNDGKYEYSKDTLITEEQFYRWKEKYKQKIRLLKGIYNDDQEFSYHDLYDLFKKQMNVVNKGEKLQYNSDEAVHINLNKLNIPLSKQLDKLHLDSDKIREIEDNGIILKRNTNLTITHLREHIANLKDMSIATKLAYSPRIMINPTKCPVSKMSLDDIDYCNKEHIYGMLKLPEMELSPDNQLSILSYDLHKMIRRLYKKNKLDDRDLYILEGLRHNVSQEDLAKELEIDQSVVSRLSKRIAKDIANGFKEDKEDLIYLNKYKGEYKKCSKCGKVKLIQRFDKNGKKGHMSICKSCRRI